MKLRSFGRSRVRGICAGVLLASCGSSASQDASNADVIVADTSVDTASESSVDALTETSTDVASDLPLSDGTLLADASDAIAMGDTSDVGPYPAGPYGNAMGDILQNLSWVGYENPTGHVQSDTLPYGPTSMQAQRMLGRRYGLVHVSEFY